MTLQCEAARKFGWTSEDTMDDGADGCDHKHESCGTCSCAVALEIKRHGSSLLFIAESQSVASIAFMKVVVRNHMSN